jgi:hypothetical protein
MINIDELLPNADWLKRTPDTFSSLNTTISPRADEAAQAEINNAITEDRNKLWQGGDTGEGGESDESGE